MPISVVKTSSMTLWYFCQRHINLVFGEDKMEPARLEEASKNAGIDPISNEPVI